MQSHLHIINFNTFRIVLKNCIRGLLGWHHAPIYYYYTDSYVSFKLYMNRLNPKLFVHYFTFHLVCSNIFENPSFFVLMY